MATAHVTVRLTPERIPWVSGSVDDRASPEARARFVLDAPLVWRTRLQLKTPEEHVTVLES